MANMIIITHVDNTMNLTCNTGSDDYIYTKHGVKSGFYYTKDSLAKLMTIEHLMLNALENVKKQTKDIENFLNINHVPIYVIK